MVLLGVGTCIAWCRNLHLSRSLVRARATRVALGQGRLHRQDTTHAPPAGTWRKGEEAPDHVNSPLEPKDSNE